MKKFFRRALTAIFIVACVISATICVAAVQIFDGKGEWHTNDDDNQKIAMSRASQRAQLDAQKKAGVYLKTFSKTVNLELAEDEISAVTNNIIEIIGEVNFDKKIIPLSDSQTTILYTATLQAKIDPDGIYDWINRDETDKVAILRQNNDLQDAIQRNDELAENLQEQYRSATSQDEKNQIREQINDADREFLAEQKLDAGNKLYYAKNYNGAMKLYDEAIQINPNYFGAYNNRGNVYDDLRQYERAIQDYDKAIELNPNYVLAYNNRGSVYDNLNQYDRAIQDYDEAIRLNPNFDKAYYNRGNAYLHKQQYEQAFQNFDKAIQINPNYALAYNNRGIIHFHNKQYERAVKDFDRAIQLNPNYTEAYNNRGAAYYFLKDYRQAIKSLDKALELNPNFERAKKTRQLCIEAMSK
ncbi:MAG: tetratricopeptide repeat protein [Selenomonadaceae bacterium]|nr:tetratricopeptide repeat protein [Selenomonadaceae bacterium]